MESTITFGIVRDGSTISSPFSATNFAPPHAKLKSATPVKKFFGPFGIRLDTVGVRASQLTLGRPNTINKNRLKSNSTTMPFCTSALDFSPMRLMAVQITSAAIATADSPNCGKIEQK